MRHFPSIPCVVVLVLAAGAAAQEPKERAVLKGHEEAAWHLAFSPDGKLLASCGEPRLKVWDVATGKEVATFEAPEEDARWGRSVAFSPDGKSVAFSWDTGTIQFWDTTGKGKVTTLGLKSDGMAALAYASGGRILAFPVTSPSSPAASSQGTSIKLWDLPTQKELAVLTGHTKTIFSVAISPDDQTIVSAGDDRTVRLWDLGARRQRAVLEGHKAAVWTVAIAPDGKTVASGSTDGVVKFWDVKTGELLATLDGHPRHVSSMAFTPDGSVLASTGGDNRLRFWDVRTRQERLTMIVPGEMVRGVVFTRDGRTMATGNADGKIRLWDVADRKHPLSRSPADGVYRKDIVAGGLAHSPGKWMRVRGKVRVLNGYTIVFEDGKKVAVADGPELEQQGKVGDTFYPAGKEAAAFLQTLIGDRTVTMYMDIHSEEYRRGDVKDGPCFVGGMSLEIELIRNGWAIAHHSGMVPFEIDARQNKSGLWRGEFVSPTRWRKGERLPGEPVVPKRSSPDKSVKGRRPSEPEPKRVVNQSIVLKDGSRVIKLSGRVKVLDAHTLRYEDGTELELNGGMDAPDLAQSASMGDTLYPWGKEAAEFLRKLVGDRVVTCYVEGRRRAKLHGACFVGETSLEIEMVRNGWAVSHHTAMDGWEIIASENKRGVWRGKFIEPERWRKGDRLPGETGETESQRQAVAALRRLDPVITYDETKPGKPVIAVRFRPNTLAKVTDDDMVHLKSFYNLRSVDVPSSPKVTDAGLEHLADLRPLVELNVNWTQVSAAGVVRLVRGRRMMQRLEVAGVKFRDDDLAMLKGLPYLRTLSLRATRVTDKGLEHLKSLENPRTLSLMSTGIGDAGLKHLETLTTLEDLDLDRTAITDAGLQHLKGLRNLRRLQMAHTAVTDAGLEHLLGLSKLKELNVRGTSITREATEKLRQRIPGLQVGLGPAPK
jgi:WD40 repeat protein